MLGLTCFTQTASKITKCQFSFPICDALVQFFWWNFFIVAIIFVLLVTAEALPKSVPLSTLLNLFSLHSCLYSTVAVEKRSGKAQNGKFGRLFVYLWWDFDFCTDSCRLFLFSTFSPTKDSVKFVRKGIHVEFERSRYLWIHQCLKFGFEDG